MGFLTLNEDVLERWKKSAAIAGIPCEAYKPKAKVIRDNSGRSDYTFGAILNGYRSKRPIGESQLCHLCSAIEEVKSNDLRSLVHYSELPGFVVMPNKFPVNEGTSLAITEGTGSSEISMYNTGQLKNLASDLERLTYFA